MPRGRHDITDTILLYIFGQSLDDGYMMNLQRQKESDEITSYERYLEELAMSLGILKASPTDRPGKPCGCRMRVGLPCRSSDF